MYEISARLSGLWDSYAHKLLCILKMTMVILLVSISPLQASNVFGQRINYVQKQVSLEQIFKEIKKQTRYNIVWFEDNLNPKATQDVNFKNAGIEEVMDRILSNQSASYEINNKTIVIKSKAPGTGEKLKKAILNFFEALIDVTGRVVDEHGDPLPGAKVKVNGTKNINTATNANGEFTLKEIADNATITISFIGYETKELPVSANMGAIKLAQSDAKLEEVEINAGYYTVKDKERTGSISRVTAETISKQPINNPLQALQGRVPGLEIVQTTGLPGGNFNVRIRGQNSIANGNDPLYVIDGIQFQPTSLTATFNQATPGASPLSSINTADIETLEILKDADATAIYGSRGANGVILITTKKGNSGALKTEISVYQGAGKVTSYIDLLNTSQYIEMRKEAFRNDKLNPGTADYDVNGTWDQTRYTDWQKELIGGTANTSNIQLSLSGGNSNTTFLTSGNYYKETTVFPGDSNYQKKGGLLNLNHSTTDQKFNMQISVRYSDEDTSLPNFDLTTAITLPPNAPSLRTSTGEINWENGTFRNNPLSYLLKPFRGNTGSFTATGNFSYILIPGLNLSLRGGYTKMQRDELQITPLISLYPTGTLTSANRVTNYADNRAETLNLEPQLSWTKTLGFGKLNVLIGTTIQQNQFNTQSIQGTGYNSDGLMESIAAAASLRVSKAVNSEYRYISVYGRANYGLKDRYFLNLTGRRDGSSRFGRENIYANFWAVGTGWIFSEEKFINEHLSFLSFGKLRASYGISGNDQIGDYQYLELWMPTANTYQGQPSLFPSRLSNSTYGWEVNAKAELALELGFLEDRLHLTTAFFRNRSSNQLVRYILAPSTGFTSILANLPATVQNTGWELEIASNNMIKKNLKWSSYLNLSIPRNKLISFPDIEKSSYSSTYVVGESLNIIKSLKSKGVDPATGIYVFEDFDGSGGVTIPGDLKTITRLGQKFAGGLQNTFSYKNLELDFLFQFVKQVGRNYIYNASAPGGFTNQPVAVLNRWQEPGQLTNTQKYVTATNLPYSYAKAFADLSVSDASFIRLKNLSLAYRFKEKSLNAINIKNAKVFCEAQNLLTISNFLGMDPESQNFVGLPPLRMVSVGFQASF